MSVPVLPATLIPPLSGRDAVADALYRGVIGLDTADEALFKSALTTDAVFDLNGTILNGLDAIISQCYAKIAKMNTSHFITNLRINITDEDSKAHLTCSTLAQHYGGGEGMKGDSTQLLAGGLYYVELVKDSGDGLWKVKHWTLKSTWAQGDWGVFSK